MGPKRWAIGAATLVWLTAGVPADIEAQVPSELALASLEELMAVRVITATLTSEVIADVPAGVHVVTAAQIARRGYRSLIDLLKDVPEVKVDLGGDPDFPSQLTVLGGRGADRVVVLLDGVRVSSPTNEPLPILGNYPVHAARQVEVIFGPASALYGADAFSAVINIISRDPAEAPGLSVTTSVGQHRRYDQAASYAATLAAEHDLLIAGQFSVDGGADLSEAYSGDLGDLTGQRTGTFATIFGPMVAAGAMSPTYEAPSAAHSVQAAYRRRGLRLLMFHNRLKVSTSRPYTPDNAVYDGRAFNDNRLLVLSGTYSRRLAGATSATSVTLSRHELSPRSGYWNVYSNLKRSYKYAYGSLARIEQQMSWRTRTATTVTAGGAVERFFAMPQGADLNAPVTSRSRPGTILDTTIVDDFVRLRYYNTGAYVQLQRTLGARISATAGARVDHNTRYGTTFNPRVGLVVRPGSRTRVKVLYGTAYLAPSPYQAHSHYGSFYSLDGGATYASDYWHLPNPDLEPQRKQTLEVRFLRDLTRHVALSASAHYSRLENLIVHSDAEQAYRGLYLGWPVAYIDFPVNEGRQTTFGASVKLNAVRPFGERGRVEAYAAAAVVEGRDWKETVRDRLQTGAVAPVLLQLGADVDWQRWSVAPRLVVAGPQRVLAVSEASPRERRTLPGYATMDVTIRRQHVGRHVDAFVTVENAFDRRYRAINARAFTHPEELVGVPQDPRRITVGVSLRVPR